MIFAPDLLKLRHCSGITDRFEGSAAGKRVLFKQPGRCRQFHRFQVGTALKRTLTNHGNSIGEGSLFDCRMIRESARTDTDNDLQVIEP